jgi:ribose-phosphate pyrophosphokinase
MHVRLSSIPASDVHVSFEFKDSDDIIELLLVANALKHCGVGIEKLRIGYMPFGRQDRVATDGDAFSLEVFAGLVNSIHANEVIVVDPHSDVTPALIQNCSIIKQCDVFRPYLTGQKDFYLISPDGGSLKKVYQLAKIVNTLGVIECSKLRDVKTGEITETVVHCSEDLGKADCYIVDDICDGGRTFIEIAKILKERNCGKIILMVSHGLFTKGIGVFKGYIDMVITSHGNMTDESDDAE